MQVTGKLEVEPYTSKETPMIMYLNTHAALEQLRQKAEQDQAR
jgi:polyribonucleotide 5'-hydroxyl-kinase